MAGNKLVNSIASLLSICVFSLLLITFTISFAYLFYSLIPVHIFIALLFFALSGYFLLKNKWNSILKQGILRKMPNKLRVLLLQRSLLDIWSDIVYFPTFSKIIGAFVRSAVVKPSPQKLHQQFSHLSPKFQQVLTTKGLLHLAPSQIQKMCIQRPQVPIHLPQSYGKMSNQWYNRQKYDKHPIKVHQVSMAQSFFQKVQQKIKWQHIAAMSIVLSLGVKKMKVKRMSKMMIQNGVFVGVILLCVMILVKTRTSKKNNSIVHLQIDVQKAA